MALEDKLYPLLRAYMGAPQWLKSIAGNLYSQLPLLLRRGSTYKRFRDELAVRDLAAIIALRDIKLKETIEWAITTVPAYSKFAPLLKDGLAPTELLSRLPVVTKADIKGNLSAYMSGGIPPGGRLKTYTGGSTAAPMMFYLQKGLSRSREYAFMDRFHARVGMSDNDTVLALRGRTVPGAGQPGGRMWMYEPIKRQLILSSDHLEPRYMPEYMEALRKWKPRYIQAFPSALYPLSRWLSAHPEPEVTACFRGVMLYSENVYDYQMRLFRQVFGCPVLKHYGHSERVLMAATMPDDERYFFWPQYGYFELVDEAGRPITRPGVLGEITGTSYDNRAMPFIRYRTGDLAMLSEPPHPLLPGYPVVARIEGRLQEFLVTQDRRLISICTMGAAPFEELVAVEAIQYEQNEPGRFSLKVATRAPLTEAAKASIVRAVREKTQGGCAVELLEVSEIPRIASGKHRMLIQNLNLSDYLGAAITE